MKPLISYYGGKQRMAPRIVPLIPPHTVYVEPFAGGAAVFYAKPVPKTTNNNHYREVLNDINGQLVQMYMAAMRDPDLFSSTIKSLPFSRALHFICSQIDQVSLLGGIAKYVKHTQSFSFKEGGGFSRSTLANNQSDTFFRRTQESRDSAKRLCGVTLDCEDAIKMIRIWDSPQTFFYVDPPYLGTNCDGMGSWSLDNASELASTMNATKGSWIVSGYNELRGILKYDRTMSFSSNCGATGVGKTQSTRNFGEPVKGVGRERIERLFMRGPSHPVRSQLIPILEKQTCFTGPLLGPCPLPLKYHPSARK